jgi:uncharacterized membrane protein YgcG
MKSITEFPNHLLVRGIEAKATLVTEGKTPEEIQASLGTSFKFEGDRLKHFFNALDVAERNAGLSRLIVISLAEGETAPPKAIKVEECYYLPEFFVAAPPPQQSRDGKGGRGRGGPGGRGGGGGGNRGGGNDLKGSPWGLSPEQKAAKKGGGKTP